MEARAQSHQILPRSEIRAERREEQNVSNNTLNILSEQRAVSSIEIKQSAKKKKVKTLVVPQFETNKNVSCPSISYLSRQYK